MSKFLKGIKGNTPELKSTPELSVQAIDALAEKLHTVEEKTVATKSATPKNTKSKPKKTTAARATAAAEPKNLHRLTLDLPTELMEKIKIQTKNNGQTVKGFIMTLLNKHFENQ